MVPADRAAGPETAGAHTATASARVATATAPRVAPALAPALATAPRVAPGPRSSTTASAFGVVPELLPESKAELEAGAFARRVTSTAPAERSELDGSASALALPTSALEPTRMRELSGPFARLLADPGDGRAVPPSVRDRVAEVSDQSLEGIRVHTGEDAARAAHEAGVAAFSFGDDIYLSAGIAPDDLEVMAHEIAHVLQQREGGGAALAPWGLFDWLLDEVAEFLRGFAAYRALITVLGRDPLTGQESGLTSDQRIAELVRLAGFPAAAAVIEELAIISTVGEILDRSIRQHRLTVDRVLGDIQDAATSPSSAGAVAQRLFDDAVSAILQAGAEIIQHVRTVLAPYIERALERNERAAALWRLATGVLHYDPLRGQDVDRSTEQMLVDFFTFVGKPSVIDQMRERGTLAQTVEWLDAKLALFAALKARVLALVGSVLDALSLESLGSLPTTIEGLITGGMAILEDIATFAVTLVLEALAMFKESLLALASEYAMRVPGFSVVRVMLGYDPFTRAAVETGTLPLLQELVKLFASEETYQSLSESGRLGKAADAIDEAIDTLGISPKLVLDTIAGVWDLITWESILHPLDTFGQILALFGDPLARIAAFLLVVVQEIVKVIVIGMGFPEDVVPRIIENVQAAAADIKRDPVGFLLNLVQTVVQGFEGFAENIGDHLLAGLTSWLLRGVRELGITIPEEITLESAITLVLEVLGLSLDMLWTKIGERIGPERAEMLRSLPEKIEEVFAFIKGVQEGGIGFLWEQLSERLATLWDTLFEKAMAWITETVVTMAVTRVVAMLAVPGLGAAMGAINTVIAAMQTLVEYLADIALMIDRIVTTIAEIARGDLGPSAKGVEEALAAALPFAIGFLANFLGLGDVPEKIKEIIESLREMVDQAVDWLLDRAIELGRSILDSLTGGGDAAADPAVGPDAAGAAGGAPVGAIDQVISIPGDTHHIRSDGPGGALMLHSDEAIRLDELEQLTNLVMAFMATRNIDAQAQVAAAGPANDRSAQAMAQLVAAITALGNEGIFFAPRRSGVGVGNRSLHGKQAQRTRAIQRSVTHLLSTESEHVIPFEVGQTLWTSMLEEEPQARGNFAVRDHGQTTVVIYYAAARLKTAGANTKIPLGGKGAAFIHAMQGAGGSDLTAIDRARRDPAARAQSRAALERTARERLSSEVTTGVARTVEAVKAEWELVEVRGGPADFANGPRRNESAPVPTEGQIKTAADEQVENLITMLIASFTAP